MKSMKILISGAGFVNKGAEAMLRTVQMELTKRFPDAEFLLWGIPSISGKLALASGLNTFQLPFERENSVWNSMGLGRGKFAWAVIELISSCNLRNIVQLWHYKQIIYNACSYYVDRNLKDVDALIDISGFAYGDAWNDRGFKRILPIINYCHKRGKPVVFLPQAWGSFEKPVVRNAIREFLNYKNTIFYSRDRSSCRHLEKALDKLSGSINASPDIVFNFQGSSQKQGVRILESMGCSLSRNIVGISPNMKVYDRVPGSGCGNFYLQTLVTFVKHCLENHDVDIVLQANEIDEVNLRKDDRYLCSLIYAAVNRPDRCFMTRECLTAESSKALIGCFDYLLSSRFHSLVFGFSQGVPGMAVSWSHKYRELLNQFGMGEYVQECPDLDPNVLISMFEHGWHNKDKKRQFILEKMKSIQMKVDDIFDETASKILKSVLS